MLTKRDIILNSKDVMLLKSKGYGVLCLEGNDEVVVMSRPNTFDIFDEGMKCVCSFGLWTPIFLISMFLNRKRKKMLTLEVKVVKMKEW